MHLLAQAAEVAPSDPAALAWPAVAGGVAAIVMTAGMLWRGWRYIRRQLVDPLSRMLADWHGHAAEDGRPAVPGVPTRLAVVERHLGNGVDTPLRQEIALNSVKLAEVAEVAHRADRQSTAALTLAQTSAAQIADHYVRGHG